MQTTKEKNKSWTLKKQERKKRGGKRGKNFYYYYYYYFSFCRQNMLCCLTAASEQQLNKSVKMFIYDSRLLLSLARSDCAAAAAAGLHCATWWKTFKWRTKDWNKERRTTPTAVSSSRGRRKNKAVNVTFVFSKYRIWSDQGRECCCCCFRAGPRARLIVSFAAKYTHTRRRRRRRTMAASWPLHDEDDEDDEDDDDERKSCW